MDRLKQYLRMWLMGPLTAKLLDLERNQTALALEIVVLKQAIRPMLDVMPNPATARASRTTDTVFDPTVGRL